MAFKRLAVDAAAEDPFEAKLRERFIGHGDVVQELSSAVRRYHAGLSIPNRPAAIYLVVGPTGSGKTHCVNTFARSLTGFDPLRIDCGEYAQSHEMSRLIGAPAGYLGHRETQALLSNKVLATQHRDDSNASVVLFDEIDKANPRLLDLLLGIFDSGRLRLGDNEITDFTNTFCFMTANTGARQMQEALNPTFGFCTGIPTDASTGKIAQRAVKKVLRPEMYNRLDKVLVFDQLTREEVQQVSVIEVAKIEERLLRGAGVGLSMTSAARDYVAAKGYEPAYGARHLNRVLEHEIIRPVTNLITSKQVRKGSVVIVDFDKGGLAFHAR